MTKDAFYLQGHKIKNTATQLAQKLRQVAVKTRLIISGTPVQNNLGEMHALFDFVQPVWPPELYAKHRHALCDTSC
jgi:SNF2 family DNA or RNA helicase